MSDVTYIARKVASRATQSHFLSNDSKVGINVELEKVVSQVTTQDRQYSLSGLSYYIMVTPHVKVFFKNIINIFRNILE